MVREDGKKKKKKFGATVTVQHCSRHQQDKGINRWSLELEEKAGIQTVILWTGIEKLKGIMFPTKSTVGELSS